MRKINLYTAAKSAILFTLVLLLNTSLFAQTDAKKETPTNVSPTVNTQTVNAQQSGSWTVGIDQTKNTVQLSNSLANPLPVKLVDSGSSRKPFQTRLAGISSDRADGQGIFNGATTATANHKIGISHFNVAIEVRLDTASTESASGQVTLSGYVEDVPTL
jgi:hypothetical protein